MSPNQQVLDLVDLFFREINVAECSAHTVPLQIFSVTATRAGRVFIVADKSVSSSSSVCTLL